jgi:hypothetical protein
MNVAGIDVGHKGGLAIFNTDTGEIRLWEMPPEQNRGTNLEELWQILQSWPSDTIVGLEYNTCRPGEVPDFAMRFGIQTGELRAALFSFKFETMLVFPQVWMGKLGLWGKQNDPHLQYRMALIREKYPHAEPLLVGPRGGIKDGLVEALLIAEWVRLMHCTPLQKFTGPRPPRFLGLTPE